IKKIFKYSLIGITALFFMNILRIMILMIVGYYYGTEKMLFVHYNLGWILFALGISVFWYLVLDDF
ncbi:MAG: exosortase/archaeosortase family protein, partial [Methanosarcinales archaeon]